MEGYTGGGGAGLYGVPAGPELFWLRPQESLTRELPIGYPCIWLIAISAACLRTNWTKPQPFPGGILT